MYEIMCRMLHYDVMRYAVSVIVVLMLVIALILAVLGIILYFADRKTCKYYKNWRGKKQWKSEIDEYYRQKCILRDAIARMERDHEDVKPRNL